MDIKTVIQMDRIGNIEVCPISMNVRQTIREHLAQFMPDHYELCIAFFNDGAESQQFMEYFLTDHEANELNNGYSVHKSFDPDVLGMIYGYDTDTIL